MKKGRVWTIAVGFLLCLLTIGNAFGADLTLVVPVNLSNLPPQVVSVWVNCAFVGVKPGVLAQDKIAEAWAPVPGPVNGVVNTFVTVGVVLPDLAKTVYVKYGYQCTLDLSPDATHNTIYPPNSPKAPWAATKQGTTAQTYVEGYFP